MYRCDASTTALPTCSPPAHVVCDSHSPWRIYRVRDVHIELCICVMDYNSVYASWTITNSVYLCVHHELCICVMVTHIVHDAYTEWCTPRVCDSHTFTHRCDSSTITLLTCWRHLQCFCAMSTIPSRCIRVTNHAYESWTMYMRYKLCIWLLTSLAVFLCDVDYSIQVYMSHELCIRVTNHAYESWTIHD